MDLLIFLISTKMKFGVRNYPFTDLETKKNQAYLKYVSAWIIYLIPMLEWAPISRAQLGGWSENPCHQRRPLFHREDDREKGWLLF